MIASKSQISELDKLMVDRYGVSVLQMMEIAGLSVAQLAMQVSKGKRILVLCGHGNNGGDGLCAARHLINYGYSVSIIIAKKELSEPSEKQFNTLIKMGININYWPTDIEFSNFDLIIDALLGFNLVGNPREPYASIIRQANSSGIPILSVDVPSGLDADSGEAYSPCIKASYTLALSAVKKGCVIGKEFVGELYLGYIGVPDELYEELKIEKPAFAGILQKVQL